MGILFKKCALKPIEKKNIGEIIYEKKAVSKSHSEIEEQYKNLYDECNEWKKLANRYLDEKKFLQTRLFSHDKIDYIFGYKLRYFFSFIRTRGVLFLLLVINLFFLFLVWADLSTENKRFTKQLYSYEDKRKIFPYVIQVAVFKDFNKAKNMVNFLKKRDFSAYIYKPVFSKSDYYRVYVNGHLCTAA